MGKALQSAIDRFQKAGHALNDLPCKTERYANETLIGKVFNLVNGAVLLGEGILWVPSDAFRENM